jgi:hypothetical protein
MPEMRDLRSGQSSKSVVPGRPSEVEGGHDGGVVGAWFALARVRVVIDRARRA